MLLQVVHVGIALEEPQKFVDDAFEVELLRCKQGEAFIEVKAHLIAEGTDCTCPCAVIFRVTNL